MESEEDVRKQQKQQKEEYMVCDLPRASLL